MGKTMPKSTVIYGQQHAIAVSSFSGSHVNNIIALLKDKVGPDVVDPIEGTLRTAINRAVNAAKSNKKMKDAYVKIGLIDGNLILRAKEKKFFGDIEIDEVLIKNYKPKASQYAIKKVELEMAALEKAKEEQQKQERLKQEALEKEKAEKERQERLHKVMNTPDDQGETLRQKMLRAAEKGKKLGVGQGTQERLDRQGLQEMDQQYHGEVLDHQKNRYGRYLQPLMDVWTKAEPGMNMSQWLDEVEKGNMSVKGVAQARDLESEELGGKIVQVLGTAGGLMIYLDDNTRKAYEARPAKGALSGTNVPASGDAIFVIGPDNKVYAGKKQRAQPGQRGAFNHSSFFSGGPVKSAGTIRLSGGKITDVFDLSGHYTPTRAMVATAVRKFGGGDEEWLKAVNVKVGSKTLKGDVFLNEDADIKARQTWGKYSHGTMSREDAVKLLQAKDDGAWLLRYGSDGSFVVSARQGTKYNHVHAYLLGSLGLDRQKLVPPTEKPAPSTLTPDQTAQLRLSPAYHGALNRVASETLLTGKPDGSWLLREGRGQLVALSFVAGGTVKHSLIDSATALTNAQAYMRTNRAKRVAA
jgi:hypothetical protein